LTLPVELRPASAHSGAHRALSAREVSLR